MNFGKRLIAGLMLLLFVNACAGPSQMPPIPVGSQAPQQPVEEEVVRLRVAQQFGLGYAALTIADELGIFEKYLPELRVTWLQPGSDDAILDAFSAGDIDVALMDIPTFLIGWDLGIPWKVASGICVMPVSLQTNQEDINDLVDFIPDDMIAYTAPDSLEGLLLSMAAEKALGSLTALDDIAVAMKEPDAVAALLDQSEIAGHFVSPPFAFQELKDPRIKMILTGKEIFGADFSYLVAVASNDLFENNPNAYAAFVMGIAEATEFINQNPEEAATILSPSLGLDQATTLEYLTWPGMNYVTTPLGLMGFSQFMLNAGFLSSAPERISDIAFSNVQAAIGEQQGEPGVIEELQFRP